MNSEIRSYNPWIWLILPLWCLAFLVLFPPHQLDIAVSRLFWIDGDWPWHHNPFFTEVLHKGAKAVPIVVALWVVYRLFRLSIKKSEEAWQEKRKRYAYVFIAMLASVLLCWWLKQTTGVSCPWSTSAFGGTDPITDPGWSFRAGNCWPGGHAGSGFCLFALFFALRDQRKTLARWCLLAVFVFGSICGFARLMQGAHFLSHNLATMLIDWIVCAVIYVLIFDRKKILSRFVNIGHKPLAARCSHSAFLDDFPRCPLLAHAHCLCRVRPLPDRSDAIFNDGIDFEFLFCRPGCH